MAGNKQDSDRRAVDFSARVMIVALSALLVGLVALSIGQYYQLYLLKSQVDTMSTTGQEAYQSETQRSPANDVTNSGSSVNSMKRSNLSPGDNGKPVVKRSTDADCGGEILLNHFSDYQEFTSPNYPEPYGNNLDCIWVIRFDRYPTPLAYAGSQETQLTYLFLSFDGPIDIEASSDCRYDFLEIRSGYEDGPVLKKFCGPQNSTEDIVRSGVTTPLYVRLHTDHVVGKKGFSATLTVRVAGAFLPSAGLSGADHAVFTRWGRSTCSAGKVYFDGYVAGYQRGGGNSVATQKLQCVPLPLDFVHNDTVVSTPALLTFASFDLRGNDGVFENGVDGRLIRCALCDTLGDEKFTVIGWNECHSREWITAYSGYLMADVSSDGQVTSDPICMDESPEQSDESGVSGLAVNFVSSGKGFWYQNKPIPCAVCIREEPV